MSGDISVIMSIYNEELKWIKQSIESILNQSYKNFEFIIVIDNPERRDIIDLVQNYSKNDSRIKVIENEKNIGLINSLNEAIKVANGKYIARIDADDISIHNRLEIQKEFLEENRNIDFCGSNAIFIDEEDEQIECEFIFVEEHEKIKEMLNYTNVFLHPSWFMKKEIFDKLGAYRNVPSAEDYDFITSIITEGFKVANINKTLIKYRIRKNSISRTNVFAQVKASYLVQKMYKKRLKNKSDEKLLNNASIFIADRSNEREFFEAKYTMEKAEASIGIEKYMLFIKAALKNKYIAHNIKNKIKFKFKFKVN